MASEVAQLIADSKLVGPKERVADAFIDYGGEADLRKIAEITGVSAAVIHRMIATEAFQTFFKRRLIQRGFDGIRLQEKVNELAYTVVEELVERVRDKDRRKKMSEHKLLDILTMAQKAVRYRAQAETLLIANNHGRKFIQDHEDVVARMKTVRSGRRLLEGKEVKN